MADTQTLELDFVPPSKSSATGSARIFIACATSYLKENGETVISGDCDSPQALRDAIDRLKRELSLLEEEGVKHFAAKGGGAGTNAAEPSDVAPILVNDPAKTALRIDRSLVVADRMTHPVITVQRNQTLDEALTELRAGKFRHLVVTDDETKEVVGVVSQRQIALSSLDWVMGHGVAAYQKMIAATPVKDVMETKIITISQNAPLADAAAILMEHKIGCLPVMNATQLVGILTEGDFVAMLRDATVGQSE